LLRTEEQAAYQAAAEAVVASEFGAEVFGLEIKPVVPMMAARGMEDWKGRCLRAGGVLEFDTINEIYDYGAYAGEDALADRIRRLGMCLFAPLAGYELLTGKTDKGADLEAIIKKIPTGAIADDWNHEEALLNEYFEQCQEAVESRQSVVQALAQRLLPRRSLKAEEIAEVLEVSDT